MEDGTDPRSILRSVNPSACMHVAASLRRPALAHALPEDVPAPALWLLLRRFMVQFITRSQLLRHKQASPRAAATVRRREPIPTFDRVVALLQSSSRILVLTGAGVRAEVFQRLSITSRRSRRRAASPTSALRTDCMRGSRWTIPASRAQRHGDTRHRTFLTPAGHVQHGLFPARPAAVLPVCARNLPRHL